VDIEKVEVIIRLPNVDIDKVEATNVQSQKQLIVIKMNKSTMPSTLPKKITRGTKRVIQNVATVLVKPKGQKKESIEVLNLLGSSPSKSLNTRCKCAPQKQFAFVSSSYNVLCGTYLDLLGSKDKIGIMS
jgi:hypothetical protein